MLIKIVRRFNDVRYLVDQGAAFVVIQPGDVFERTLGAQARLIDYIRTLNPTGAPK